MADKGKSRGPQIKGQALKDFRSSVAKLKSKGLVSKRVDARSQKPTRYMRSKVKALEPVLSGRLAPVKRSPRIAREYKLAGFKVVNGRLLLPPDQTRSVRNSRNEYATMEKMTAGGTIERRVILPVTVRNIQDFLSDEDRIEKLIGPGRRLAFTYYGNRSLHTFPTASALFERLQHYSVVTGKRAEQEQAWDNLVLFDIREDKAETWEGEAREDRAERSRLRRANRPRRMRHDATGRTIEPGKRYVPKTYAEVKAQNAAYQKAKRAKEGGDVRADRLAKNRDRVRAHRAKLKGQP